MRLPEIASALPEVAAKRVRPIVIASVRNWRDD
jgi:hypothetical protein